MAPATVIVLLATVLLIVIGVILATRSFGSLEAGREKICVCGEPNDRGSRFCRRCGQPLPPPPTSSKS